MQTLGIDIGGTGIKGAVIETQTGVLVTERYRLLTPESGKPKAMAKVVGEIVEHFDWKGPIGAGFPAVVQNGVVWSAANIHSSWVGVDGEALLREHTGGLPVRLVNDADAAGIAEMTFGAGKGNQGVVMIITIGTGLGSALFVKGVLVPNTELGHLEIDGADAEQNASDAARQREKLSWKKWAKKFDRYLQTIERLFSPDMIILGGGAVKSFDKFSSELTVRAKVVPAELLNEAGIVGAGLLAADLASPA